MTKSRFTSPVMRFVQGSVDEAQTKDQQGNLRVVKTGPNAGQPNPQYFIGGAIQKTDPAWPAMWASLVNQAVADFPNLFPQGAAPVIAAGGPTMTGPAMNVLVQQGVVAHPQFSFKVIDGDGWDTNGKANNTKEGFAGCWVIRFGSSYPPRCFHAGHYAAHEQIQEKNAIKRGFFIRINGSIEGNGNAQRPGLYVNLDMIELAYVGPEIVSGPSAEDAFAGGPGAMPAGATPMGQTPGAGGPVRPTDPAHIHAAGTPGEMWFLNGAWVAKPVAPAAPPPPPAAPPPPPPPVTAGPQRPTDPAHIHAAGTPGEQWYVNGAWTPAPAAAAPPPPPATPPAPPPPPAAPYTGFMEGAPPPPPGAPAAGAPPPPPSAPPATPSPTRTMLPKAGASTYEQLTAAGWTDETLRAHGMMA